MALSAMSVALMFQVLPRLPTNISILLRGPHGIGKSQVVRQIAKTIAANEGIEHLEVVDRRLSQMSEGDMVGLPSTDGNVTRFNPPDWFKKVCDTPVVLFLDELNRATHEVMQAAFQIVLDRELNGWRLHPQTRVFSAINNGSEYTVNEVDPALLDRFFVIDMRPTAEDWRKWAADPALGNINETIIDFCMQNDKWLDPPKNAEPGCKHTSRRSWERLDQSMKAAGIVEDPNSHLFYPLAVGFVGVEAAAAFHDFAKSIDNRVTGEDVINHYQSKTKRVQEKVKRLKSDKILPVIEKVAEYILKQKKISDKQGKNLQLFLYDLGDEHRVNAWTKLAVMGVDQLELVKSVHQWTAEPLMKVFGVPMGKAGIGVTPNIPTMFQDKNKT